MKSFFLIL